MAEGKNSKLVKLVGLSVVGAGVSHFVKPQLFESITKLLEAVEMFFLRLDNNLTEVLSVIGNPA